MLCFKNAQEVKDIALLDRAFHYGDGCFTTARIVEGKIELEALHYARLKLACERLSLNVDLGLIETTLHQMQQLQSRLNGTLKVIISRGEGQRGYSLPNHPADLWVYFYPKTVESFHYESISAGVLQTAMGLSMPNLVGIKTLNRLEQVMLKQEADQLGWSEALVLDVQGSVVEGVSSNCFFRINDTWITPELRYNGVHGVMRAEILRRMQQQGIQCEQRLVDSEEISKIQSLFFCNALQPMKIATVLDQQTLMVEPCIELFNTLKLNQIA